MISVIVSTYKPDLLQKFSRSLAQTIGVEYELITIQNDAKYSLCEAYNKGIAQAKYEFYCFVHDDVIFETKDWGKRLISMMEADQTIGLIGVAGTKFKSSYPSAWGQSPCAYQFRRGHIFQLVPASNEYVHLEFDGNEVKKEAEDVVCIDGVFMFSKKVVFQRCRFDEKLLTGFHGYDIDLSLQVFYSDYRVIVDRIIVLYHGSFGNYDKNNTIANRKIAKKWWWKLPVSTKDADLSITRLKWDNFLTWKFFLLTALKKKIKKSLFRSD
jgi:GT2 family glycosyltransferase